MQLKKRLFDPRFFDYDFQLDQAVKKTEISDPTRESDSCILNVIKSRRILVRVSHIHTRTRHTRYDRTPHDNIGNAGLAAVTSAAARRESAWYILIYARQEHVAAPDNRSARYR